MGTSIAVTPYITNNAPGTFSVSTDGFVQGTLQQNPPELYQLVGGVLALTEALPMWGGVAIFENVPTPGSSTLPSDTLGAPVGRSTSVATIQGFSLFDQAYHMIQSTGNQVPLAMIGNSVHYVRLGSLARICVACDQALAVALEGGAVTQAVSWDFGAQQLSPSTAAWAANVVTASSWAATGGGQATYTTTSGHGLSVGSDIQITGETPAGYNGYFKTIAGTTGSTIVVPMPVNPGTSTVQGTLVAGGGALPCKVIRVNIGNSMTVSYNPTTGLASWNRSGSCAVILI